MVGHLLHLGRLSEGTDVICRHKSGEVYLYVAPPHY